MRLKTVEIEDLKTIKGVPFPRDVSFRRIVITGPPGSGKTTLVETLGGWPEEGYLDLAQKNWWRSRLLTFRPREVHFGFPFVGHEESHAVFDREWADSPSPIDMERLRLPPEKKWFFNIDWRARFVFDFQLLAPERIYAICQQRVKGGTHPVDETMTLEQVEHEVAVYETLATHFHRNGLRVYVRHTFQGRPRRIVDEGTDQR